MAMSEEVGVRIVNLGFFCPTLAQNPNFLVAKAEKVALFFSIKRLKLLSVNALIINQQSNN
ncbi:MAG: hypothetical protein F6K24_19075 [Okeania sp. SIO2D1]|nr:hypothetical protein [Okeania sp. SIO2D1]